RVNLPQDPFRLRTNPKVICLLDPEHFAGRINENGGRDCQFPKRAAPGSKVAVLEAIEPDNLGLGIGQQGNFPVAPAVQPLQFVNRVWAHGHKLDPEGIERLRTIMPSLQLSDTVRSPVAPIEFEQDRRSAELGKSELVALRVEGREVRRPVADRYRGGLM